MFKEKNMPITKPELALMIDHTLLKPQSTRVDLKKLCSEAIQYAFKAVCVNPVHVADAASFLKDTGVVVCAVIGFPFGTHPAGVKAAETKEVLRLGAQEIDMVIRIGALKEGRNPEVVEDIRAVVEAAVGRSVKVILETCYLTEEEKIRGCKLAMEAGAAFVKTSTGFGSAGATLEDVRLMRKAVGNRLGVKAAGGIRTLADALRMIEAGADRLGLSGSVAIIQELERSG
jgi:deoxyribose-phosphate aldolase